MVAAVRIVLATLRNDDDVDGIDGDSEDDDGMDRIGIDVETCDPFEDRLLLLLRRELKCWMEYGMVEMDDEMDSPVVAMESLVVHSQNHYFQTLDCRHSWFRPLESFEPFVSTQLSPVPAKPVSRANDVDRKGAIGVRSTIASPVSLVHIGGSVRGRDRFGRVVRRLGTLCRHR